MAEEVELDLVEIAPTASPPVCRLMDYGKFRYRESKKRHEAKLKQKQIIVKEIKFRPGTDEGDLLASAHGPRFTTSRREPRQPSASQP